MTLIVLTLLAGGGLYTVKRYKKLQKKIASELNDLPSFDREAVVKEAEKDAAEKLNTTIPVKKTSSTEEEIHEAVTQELKENARKHVSSSELSLKTNAIIKKYRFAKEGEKVTFLLNTTGKRITGIYEGIFSDWKGQLIKVDQKKYRIYDISLGNRHYFNKALSHKHASEEIAALKREFKEKRQNFIDDNKEKTVEKHYINAGSSNQGNLWKPNSEIYAELMTELLKEKERKHKRTQKRQRQGIYEDNQLFGVIPVKLKEEEEEEKEL